MRGKKGQDLIEYALVVALVAFAATAGMKKLGHRHQYCFQRYRHHAWYLHHVVSAVNGREQQKLTRLFLEGRVVEQARSTGGALPCPGNESHTET